MIEFLTVWVLVAVLTEAIMEILKNLFSDKIKDKASFATSIVVGVILAFAFGLNPFGLTGYAAYVSTVAAGILASRGSNYLHDVLKKIKTVQE